MKLRLIIFWSFLLQSLVAACAGGPVKKKPEFRGCGAVPGMEVVGDAGKYQFMLCSWSDGSVTWRPGPSTPVQERKQ